jgi:radical SAM superfamily enzyme YgiQ (UPF0313 family)
MKIALISPKSSYCISSNSKYYLSNNPIFNKFWSESNFADAYRKNWSGFSTGLLIIAALTPEEHEVLIIDENFVEVPFEEQFDVVGISILTQTSLRGYEIADEYRKRGVTVIIGGIHATIMWREAQSHSDAVVVGEAENIWPSVLDNVKKKSLKKIYCSSQPVNLELSPIPKYDIINPKHYHTFWIQTTRGCPRDCDFCSASKIFGTTYRTKSIRQVMCEIDHIVSNFGKVRISFCDDNFLTNKKRSQELLKQLQEYNLRWFAQSDISIGKHDAVLDSLEKAGCNFLFIGMESVSESSLHGIDKRNWKLSQLSHYSSFVDNIQSRGIGVLGAFMFGFDNDTMETPEAISKFIIENNLYDSQVTLLTPLPGTKLRERLVKENRLLPTKWSNYTFFDVNFVHPVLKKEELENGLLTIYRTISKKEVYLKKMTYFKEKKKKFYIKTNKKKFD